MNSGKTTSLMLKQHSVFFDFLRFCIGSVSELPTSVNDADWKVLYAIAKKQALLGVLFHGIKQLPKELAPSPSIASASLNLAQVLSATA